MWVRSLGWEEPLEKEMATHSSILAWGIPWTEEPGGLQSTGSLSQTRLSTSCHKVGTPSWCQRTRHDAETSLSQVIKHRFFLKVGMFQIV